jgi:hypothetical protein
LAPETVSALTDLAARLASAAIVFRILIIPSNGSVVVEGKVANAPDLSYRYDSDTGILQIRQNLGPVGPAVITEGHIGVDGVFRDQAGHAIGTALPNGALVDTDVLPGYRAANDADPKLCPDPSAARPGTRAGDIAYQQYVSRLINGRELPAGFAMNLLNPYSGRFVEFDDCRLTDGTMIDAKGPRYGYLIRYDAPRDSIERQFLEQASRQLDAAGGRPIEWHFASRAAADFTRTLFADNDIRITVVYTPWLRLK